MKRNLVSETADALRDRVFAAEPGTLIGSLQDLARGLGVGIVTLQQAARLLEHEGLLEARRGPGGGYYGTRPDEAALERAIAVYLRTHPASFDEALNITSLLFTELCAEAARCRDEALRGELKALGARVADCRDDQHGALESDLQDLLFRMVRWPLFELLTQVTLRFASTRARTVLNADTLDEWRVGRQRIVAAIYAKDVELARFEAERSNRQAVMGVRALSDHSGSP